MLNLELSKKSKEIKEENWCKNKKNKWKKNTLNLFNSPNESTPGLSSGKSAKKKFKKLKNFAKKSMKITNLRLIKKRENSLLPSYKNYL